MDHEKSKKKEAGLLGKIIAGDDPAFYSLFSLYNKKLTIFALKMLGDGEEARDLVQEAWIRIIELRRNPPQDAVENAGAYLFRIVRNLCFDKIKSIKVQQVPLDTVPEIDHPPAPNMEQSSLEEMVISSLEKLPAEDRELLVMHSYLGYAYEEIAEMQSKSPEAIWTRASRARAKLREFIRSDARKEGIDMVTSSKKTAKQK